MQAVWINAFAERRLSPADIARIIAKHAREGEPEHSLRAVDMAIRLTTGYAPTKSTSVSVQGRVDGFFDPDTMNNPPQIETTIEAEAATT